MLGAVTQPKAWRHAGSLKGLLLQPLAPAVIPAALNQMNQPCLSPGSPLNWLCLCREFGLNCAAMFQKQLLTLSLCCTAATLAATFSLHAENPIPPDCKTGGFFVGCQAYTFNRFSGFEDWKSKRLKSRYAK